MNRLLALFMFLLLGMTTFAQQPGTTSDSFDDRALVPQRAHLISYDGPDGISKGWLYNGLRTNTESSPDVGFLHQPLNDGAKLLAVSSDSPRRFQGFQAGTSTTRYIAPASGDGSVAGNFGGMWNFTYHGDGTSAATAHENLPYQFNTDALYANNYNDSSTLFLQLHPVYTAQTGSDRYTGTGFNLGNMFKAINARGRLITSAVHHVGGLAHKTAKLH
jgi:hypothetical protein